MIQHDLFCFIFGSLYIMCYNSSIMSDDNKDGKSVPVINATPDANAQPAAQTLPFKPRKPKMHIKVWLKIEQIARLRCAGVNDNQIKRMLGISVFGFHRITRLQEYKDVEAAMYAGTISRFDEMISSKHEVMKQYFASAVPAAMRSLVDAVLQKRDLKAKLEAAKEILDRDPKRTFTKESRQSRDDSMQERSDLPQSVLDRLGQQGASLVEEANRAQYGPSGKPN
jgi:hypothetical protein